MRFVISIILFLSVASSFGNPIPIRFCGNLIVIQATVNNKQGNYIIDTGTSHILLNKRYFSGKPSDQYFVGITGDLQEMHVAESSLQVGDLQWKNVHSQIVSMDLIENKTGIVIHGLIGSSIFRKFAVYFDYQKEQIEVIKVSRKTGDPDLKKGFTNESIALRYKGGTPTIPIVLNGCSLRVILDTGAEVNLMDLTSSKHVISDISHSYYRNIGGFGEDVKNRIVIPIPNLQVGTRYIEDTNWTVIGSWEELNYNLSGPNIQGILGYELFAKMRVCINFRNKEVYLSPHELKENPQEIAGTDITTE